MDIIYLHVLLINDWNSEFNDFEHFAGIHVFPMARAGALVQRHAAVLQVVFPMRGLAHSWTLKGLLLVLETSREKKKQTRAHFRRQEYEPFGGRLEETFYRLCSRIGLLGADHGGHGGDEDN
jgi:hypothetical protein